MLTALPIALGVLSVLSGVTAAPTLLPRFETADASSLLLPARFARAAYCSSASVKNLTCGVPCDALKNNLDVRLTGGNDKETPKFYVAHDPANKQVVVAHQGTNTGNALSVINDLVVFLKPANATRFPGLPDNTTVHQGFATAFERTADLIFNTVQSTLNDTGDKNVLVVGHSLGAAISLLDAMHLRLRLPQDVQMNTALFGLPRVGNKVWADFVDKTLAGNFARITNNEDPVVQVPSGVLGFVHPAGEVHIRAGNVTIKCVGQEDTECSRGNKLAEGSIADHRGPYFTDAIPMGSGACPGFEDEPKDDFLAGLISPEAAAKLADGTTKAATVAAGVVGTALGAIANLVGSSDSKAR